MSLKLTLTLLSFLFFISVSYQNCTPVNLKISGSEDLSVLKIEVPGLCGDSNSKSFSTSPQENLCSVGNASQVDASSVGWTWSCAGLMSGATAACSAMNSSVSVKVDGVCNNQVASSVQAPALNLCSVGIPGTVTDGVNQWNWNCIGSSDGAIASCHSTKLIPLNGVCGTSSGNTFSTLPSTNLCTTGSEQGINTTATGWAWTCQGANAGINAQCSATHTAVVQPINGTCGIATAQPSVVQPSANLCSDGNSGSVTAVGTSWSWSCNGINGGSNAGCSSVRQIMTAGICGSSAGQSLTAEPTTNLCASGIHSTLVLSGNSWTWNCIGDHGGSVIACSALKLVVVQGSCGSSKGQSFLSAPVTNLCTTGTNSVVATGSQFTWDCLGSNGGVTDQCSAVKLVAGDGACGGAQGVATVNTPSTVLCSAGTSSAVTGNGVNFTWSCQGTNGGLTSSCSAPQLIPVNGNCGSVNGQTVTSAPSSNLCTAGASSNVTLSGSTYSWSCVGQNTGTTASCSATQQVVVNGSCGSDNGQSFLSAPALNLCSQGSASVFVATGSGWTWTCQGVNGTNSNCAATKFVPANGSCGGAQGVGSVASPTANLCAAGGSSTVSNSGTTYLWTCTGSNGGTSANCSAPVLVVTNGACGAAQGVARVSSPSSALCSAGTNSAVNSTGANFIWNCSGSNGGSVANCSAPVLIPVNGLCGASNNQSYVSAPTSGLCNAGNQTSVTDNGSAFSWSCNGINSGSNTNCSALKIIPVNGVCGASNGQSSVTQPGSGYCNAGIQTSVIDTGVSWVWSCAGTSGGSSSNCSTTKLIPTNGICGSSNGQNLNTQPTSNYCSSGSFSGISFSNNTWSWSCSGTYGGSSPSCSATKIDVKPVLVDTCTAKLTGQFQSGSDVGRMMRALYCLYYFRDASADNPTVSSVDNAGVAYWAYRYQGGFSVLGKSDFVASIIDGAGGADVALVPDVTTVIQKTNFWTVGVSSSLFAFTGNPSKGQIAKMMVDSYVNQNPGSSFASTWNNYNSSNYNNLLISLYQNYFNRNPYDNRYDPGPGYWHARLAGPMSSPNLTTLLQSFLASSEFFTKSTSNGKTVMNLSNEELASFLYELAFRRNYDSGPSGDTTFWVDTIRNRRNSGQLSTQQNFVQLVIDFVNGSTEFCSKTPAACPQNVNLSAGPTYL